MLLDRETVHEALECLYDNVRLAQAGLVARFPSVAAIQPVDERAETARSTLLEAIEALRPPRRVPFGALESRSYDVLTLRYVEGMSIERMEGELSIGRRQIYRDLEEAEADLAELLSSWARAGLETPVEPGRHDFLSDELTALASDPVLVDLRELLAEAASVVRPLAVRTGVSLQELPGGEPVLALADRSILRQVLVQLLSSAVQAAGSRVEMSVDAGEESRVQVRVRFAGSLKGSQERRLLDAQRIAASQGMLCDWSESDGHVYVTLSLETGTPVSVLVVEDNPGAVELYRRYLSSRSWQLQSVSDPRVACEVARRAQPDVIVLDVMMPKLDGWSLLQSLHADDRTRHIPVLICSIVEDPELAEALGAKAYLTKPVSQGEFLAALRRCLARPA